jgi:hypothetical protein
MLSHTFYHVLFLSDATEASLLQVAALPLVSRPLARGLSCASGAMPAQRPDAAAASNDSIGHIRTAPSAREASAGPPVCC